MHPPVRALSRGLALLTELNAGGASSVQELAHRTGLNRTTTYRMLETLIIEGFVAYDEITGRFSSTPQVRRLSDGLTLRDASSQAALPAMFELMREVTWPSDFGVFDAGFVTIRESTHPFSPFSVHRAMIGRRRSLLRSALGRAILAAADDDQRQSMLDITAATGGADAVLARDTVFVDKIIAQTRVDGYAHSVGETEPNISAIAVPILHKYRVVASLNIIFFRSSLKYETASERYFRPLSIAKTNIERRLSQTM